MKQETTDLDDGATAVPSVPVEAPPPALLFEMMRSFVTLARTLNLSHAVKELKSTRQTLRRHITLLEEEMGAQLFRVDDRRYSLTEEGVNALPEALNLVAKSTMWLRGTARHQQNLQRVSFGLPNGWTFDQQQHPLSRVWNKQSVLMREALRGWAMSGGHIESPLLAHVRPYLIVYRMSDAGWITVEFGEESFYVKWFGWAAARSNIGRTVGSLPGGEDFARLLEQPFDEVTDTQGARLDHVSTQVPKGDSGEIQPIRYARLMMGGCFPDGSQALFALVEAEPEIDIEGVNNADLPPIPADVMVNFDKNAAKFEHFLKD
jgi:hypothetical protein